MKQVSAWRCSACNAVCFGRAAAEEHEKLENSWNKFLVETECVLLRHNYEVDTKGIIPKIFNSRFFYPDNRQVPDNALESLLIIRDGHTFRPTKPLSKVQPGKKLYLLVNKETFKIVGAFFWVSYPDYGGASGGISFAAACADSSISEFVRKKMLRKAEDDKRGGETFQKSINRK